MTNAAVKTTPTKTAVALEYKHNRPLTTVHWHPSSQYVFFGAEDNLAHRYEFSSKKVTPLAAHDSWVRAFGSSPDGKTLYTGGYDGRLVVWPAISAVPKPQQTIQAHDGWVRSIAVNSDGSQLATCGNDRLVKLWDAKTGKLVREFKGHQTHVYNVVFAPDNSKLISCDLKGVVNLWSLAATKPRELTTVSALHGYDTTFRADIGGARSIGLHSTGPQVALGGISNVTNAFAGVGEVAVALVDFAKGKLDRVLRSKGKSRGAAWGIAHHPEGYWIGLSGGGGGWLWFWKGDTDNEFHSLKLKSDGRGMALSPDKTHVAVAHADNHLRTYKL